MVEPLFYLEFLPFAGSPGEGRSHGFLPKLRAGRPAQQTMCKTRVIVARAPVFHPFHLHMCGLGRWGSIKDGTSTNPCQCPPHGLLCRHNCLLPPTNHIQPPNLATQEAEFQLQFSPLRDNSHKGNNCPEAWEDLAFLCKVFISLWQKTQCLLKLFYSSPFGKRPYKITAFPHQNNSWWKYQR